MTSLFSVVYDEPKTAEELDTDLERVRIWALQWKMKFNTEKTEEVIFSVKEVKPIHPPLSFGSDDVARKNKHKHFDARCGIGVIIHLSKYASRGVLDQIYKLLYKTASRLWRYYLSRI